MLDISQLYDSCPSQDPQDNITKYSYTPIGKIRVIHHSDGSYHEFIWNRLGQFIEKQLPQDGTYCYQYYRL